MFKIKIRLGVDGWHSHDFDMEEDELALAYTVTIQKVKHIVQIQALDFIPLGDGEYIVWGNGICQGYMAIKEVGPETSEPDSGGGQ